MRSVNDGNDDQLSIENKRKLFFDFNLSPRFKQPRLEAKR